MSQANVVEEHGGAVLSYFRPTVEGLRPVADGAGDVMYWAQCGMLCARTELRWGEDVVIRLKWSCMGRRVTAETAEGDWRIRPRGFWRSRVDFSRGDGVVATLRRRFLGGGALELCAGRAYRLSRRGFRHVTYSVLAPCGEAVVRFDQEATFAEVRWRVTIDPAAPQEDLTLLLLAGYFQMWMEGALGTRGPLSGM